MTDIASNLDLDSFVMDKAADNRPTFKWIPWPLITAIVVVATILSYFVSDYAIETRKLELQSELQKRLEISASGEAKVIETWLVSMAQRANRIAENELFQLFATEVNLSDSGNLPRPLAEQLPYMQSAITTFARQNDLIGAYLIGKDGRAYLSSGGAPVLENAQRDQARLQYEQRGDGIISFRAVKSGLVFDFLIPIRASQSGGTATDTETVGILLMSVPASEKLAEFIEPALFPGRTDITRLFQVRQGKFLELFPSKPPFIASQADPFLAAGKTGFEAFEFEGGDAVYSSGASVVGTSLMVFQQVAASDALKNLKTYSLFVAGLAVSFVFVVFSVLSTIWLLAKSQNARAVAAQYKEFANQINVQRRLLGSINNTIDEQIGLTNPEGLYVYANPSLARLANVPLKAIPGKTDRELFGEKAARELAEHDRKALATEQTINAFIEIETVHGMRTLRYAKSRFLNENNDFMGIVTVSSDITDYVEFQRRKEAIHNKTIAVLVQMLEANDPYLADHSSRMGRLARHLSEQLGLSPETQRILESGAQLSQIGKISIPRDIRTKEARLTEKEQQIMQEHVQVAKKIMVEAGVEKPILDAVTQINELLDGSGYPNGLHNEEIDIPARILGMTDILIARISPRAYRKTIGIDEALRVFKTNPDKYDAKIVQAMTDFFETEAGKQFKSEIEETP